MNVRCSLPIALWLSLLIGANAIGSPNIENPFADQSTKFKIPPHAIPLKTIRVFPSERDEEEGLYLRHAQSMTIDPDGLLYVPDDREDEILVFSQDGRLVRRFGQTGQGPGDFMRPTGVSCGQNFVAVRESQNRRFQLFSLEGKYLSGFRPTKYYQPFIISGDSLIGIEMVFQAPPPEDRASLITIMDLAGHIKRRFGVYRKEGKANHRLLNEACLAVTSEDHLAVAFHFVPMVRLYSMTGTLIREFETESGIIDVFGLMNKNARETMEPGTPPQGFLANAIYADDHGIYIAIAAPTRFEIILYNENGERLKCYYKDLQEWLGCTALITVQRRDGPHFFVLRMNPSCAIEEMVPAQGDKR
jgi:hypothetical protein